ncbi:hypothetical protein RND81_10G080000 [Saponaria officinalis]|uniref:Uncharacterized protein n=1 Tax=Saponaria officinalis TaxID=3572 RepID=A0AAW1I1P0_SAPOF
MAALGSEHSIVVTDEGVTLSWGGGSSGRLGHDRQSSLLGFLSNACEYTPRVINRLEGVKVKTVAAGLLHSAYVDENGNVFVFGENVVGKFSFGSDNSSGPSMLSDLPMSEEIACGGYHTCVVTVNHKTNISLSSFLSKITKTFDKYERPFAVCWWAVRWE